MTNKICPQCGQNMFHNQGISKKNGKPYENYKCKCGEIEWVDNKNASQRQIGGNKEVLDAIGLAKEDILKALREVYAKLS